MKRLQLSPIFSPKPHPHLGFDIQRTATRWEDAKFFRSWLVYDSGVEISRSQGSLNWNVIAGLVIMATVSVGGWYGIALLVSHFIK
jgi:hypothetical protein